jgi:hypothetical protein
MQNSTPSFETETRPRYPLGLVSLTLSLTPFLFLCIQIMLLAGMTGAELHYSPQAIVIECLSCIGILLPILGVILGITSLMRKEPRVVFAIAAIVLGILGSPIMVITGWLFGTLFFSAL